MAVQGICDRVAIIGMGCTRFGDHWDRSTEDLIVDAAAECFASSRLTVDDVDAFWLGTMDSGYSGLTLSAALKTGYKPVTRVENLCATGSEALRGASFAVASGACDIAMAVGVEKLKNSRFAGLVRNDPSGDGSAVETSAPAAFSYLVPAYASKYSVSDVDLRKALTHIAQKNHANGAKNPRAQFRRAVSADTIEAAPKVAGMLGVLDCSGVADGAAAAIVVRSEDAERFCTNPLYIKALSIIAGPAWGAMHPDYGFVSFPEVVACAEEAYGHAGIADPSRVISFAEVHDCFTPTEMVLMEDLGFSARGHAWRDILDGRFDLDGDLPVNPDGGLKAFGHPVGASGLRMLFEAWLQLRGEAEERQIEGADVALTHNLGGRPGRCVSFIALVGSRVGSKTTSL